MALPRKPGNIRIPVDSRLAGLPCCHLWIITKPCVQPNPQPSPARHSAEMLTTYTCPHGVDAQASAQTFARLCPLCPVARHQNLKEFWLRLKCECCTYMALTGIAARVWPVRDPSRLVASRHRNAPVSHQLRELGHARWAWRVGAVLGGVQRLPWNFRRPRPGRPPWPAFQRIKWTVV